MSNPLYKIINQGSTSHNVKKDQVSQKSVSNSNMKVKNTSDKFIPLKPEWTLDEMVLTPVVRDSLEDIVSFCESKDQIVNDWGLKKFLKGSGGVTGINFYGPPGTGKSIAADGVVSAINKNIIKVDYSEITGSLLGETEKKLTALFEEAVKSGSVIFFDEADGLLSQRNSKSSSSEANNQIKSHLLTLLDRSNVIVIFATNFFENYDRAFFRRILFHVGFDKPNKEQLVDIWKFHLNERIPKAITYDRLAELSVGLAGGDIKNITLKLCIKLSSKRIQEIDEEVVDNEIRKYRESLKASDGTKIMDLNTNEKLEE